MSLLGGNGYGVGTYGETYGVNGVGYPGGGYGWGGGWWWIIIIFIIFILFIPIWWGGFGGYGPGVGYMPGWGY